MLEGLIILLAEDDEDDVLLLRSAFAEAAYNLPLQVVPDGEQAIAYLSGEGEFQNRELHPLPSLVILDLNMPKKTGLEVVEWMRGESRFKRLPVIILSSSTQMPHINKAYELGANSYMAKGSSFPEFVDRVKLLYEYWVRCVERPDLENEQTLFDD
jgi:DNA-binding response OmpR family regulator